MSHASSSASSAAELAAARSAGLAVGPHVAIIGFDNSDAASIVGQLDQPGTAVAPEHLLLAPGLELRGSTASQ
jgi:hypothetical protein